MNWTNILIDAGLPIPIDKSEVSIVCPLHDDRVSSLSINTDKGVWICFAGCGQGPLKFFLSKYWHMSLLAVETYLGAKDVELDINFFDTFELEEAEEFVTFPEDFQGYTYPKWAFNRGFSQQTLEEWGCGTNRYDDLIIPIYTQIQELKGWVSRRANAVPKYLYSKGFKKSKHLFGINHLKRSPFVCVTEGSLDTMWLTQNGFPSIAILGAILSKTQEELLSKLPVEELVICLDNDDAGQKGKERLMACMTQNFVVSYTKLPKGVKDVQDVKTKKELEAIIQNRDIW